MYIQIDDIQNVELLHFNCISLILIFCIYKKYKTRIISSVFIVNSKYDL